MTKLSSMARKSRSTRSDRPGTTHTVPILPERGFSEVPKGQLAKPLPQARPVGPPSPKLTHDFGRVSVFGSDDLVQRTLLPSHHIVAEAGMVLQRALMNPNAFDTPEEVERDQEIAGYLRVYLEIRGFVKSYNVQQEAETGDVVRYLQLLDLIEEKVGECRRLIEKEESLGTRPVFRRLAHLYDLVESVEQERSTLLATETERKDALLAGPEAVLAGGAAWELRDEARDRWVDATGVNNGNLNVTIIDEDRGDWIFSLMSGSKKGKATKGSLTLKTKFTGDKSALYPHGVPVPEDVQQTNLGDCYLQAALSGLAAQHPAYIMNKMIYDAGDRVVVRLYKLPEKEPHFINVERSKAQTTGGVDLYNAGAMWVKMVQKAYAASGFAGDIVRNRKNISVKDISGDMVGYLMAVLTGQELESFDASGEDLQEEVKVKTPLPWSFDVGTLWEYMEDDTVPSWFRQREDRKRYYAALNLLNEIFSNNMQRIRIWAKFADDKRGDLHGFKTVSQFSTFFSNEGLDQGVAAVVMQWVEASRFYMGEVGSGKYSRGQLMIFDKIQKALDERKLVSIGTKKKLRPSQGTGFSGEPKHYGLLGGHAYAVLGARKNRTGNPDSPVSGNIFWIQLRNPWGEYSRTYDQQWNPVAIDKGNGVFWTELTDLAQNFTDVEII